MTEDMWEKAVDMNPYAQTSVRRLLRRGPRLKTKDICEEVVYKDWWHAQLH